MIYLTGDTHGDLLRVIEFCKRFELTEADVVVILGDVGLNYNLDARESFIKSQLAGLPTTILCIHGNHEMRPSHIPTYKLVDWQDGKVWREDTYPNVLFAMDGEIYDLDGWKCLVIGGAYSVDKYYRLSRGAKWWEDEQPSDEVKSQIALAVKTQSIDYVLSHTCPSKYIPREAFLPMISQSSVDNCTEQWLDTIEDSIDYIAWFCGHWHIEKRIDKMHFLFESFETLVGTR